MTALTLHYHPLSSYCQKVLIALEVLGIEVDERLLNLGDPAERCCRTMKTRRSRCACGIGFWIST
jgi:hypothetical protein